MPRVRGIEEVQGLVVGWQVAIQHLRLLTDRKKKPTLGLKEKEQERERCGVRGSREARTGTATGLIDVCLFQLSGVHKYCGQPIGGERDKSLDSQ